MPGQGGGGDRQVSDGDRVCFARGKGTSTLLVQTRMVLNGVKVLHTTALWAINFVLCILVQFKQIIKRQILSAQIL